MGTLARRETPRISDMLDWLEGGLPTMSTMRPFESRWPRLEDYQEDDRYVLRAEMPGIDPDKDLEISVADGVLTVTAERHEESKEDKRSEFRYGSFSRSCRLPKGSDEDDVTATYSDGILEITVPLREEKPESKRIEVSKS